jgi:hypothetical protein
MVKYGTFRGILSVALFAAACGDGGGSTGGTGGTGGSGEQPDVGVGGSTGGSTGGQITGGTTGGSTGGNSGGEPVGGGGAGGEPVGGGGAGGEPVGGGGAGGEPVGGSGGAGGEPVGGSGGAGGEPVGGAVACDYPLPGRLPSVEPGGEGGAGGEPVGGGQGEGGALPPPVGEVFGCDAPGDLTAALDPDGTYSVSGSTAGAAGTQSGECGGNGPESVFAFTAPSAGTWKFTTQLRGEGESYDTVLYVRTGCDDVASELTCNDDAGNLQSAVSVLLEAGQTVFVFVDSYGADGGPFTLTATPFTADLAEGAACPVDGFSGACAEGLTCLAGDEAGIGACAVPVAPTVESGELYYDPATTVLAVRLSGQDLDGDLAGTSFNVFDADGNVIPLDPFGFGFPVQFDFQSIEHVDGQYTATLVWTSGVVGIAAAEFGVYDRNNAAESETPITLEAMAPPAAEVGGECDPQGGFSTCAAGALCDAAPEAPVGTCVEGVAECPAEYEANALVLDGCGVARFDGTLDGATDKVTTSCGTEEERGDHVFTFTAPEAGDYVFQVWSVDPAANLTIDIRRFCGSRALASVVGCGTISAPVAIQLPVPLAAGETISAIVESTSAWQGAFSVGVYAAHAPTAADATVVYNDAAGSIGVTINGADVDGDVVGFGLAIFDVDGMPIVAADEAGGLIDLGVDPSELTWQDDGSVVFRGGRFFNGEAPPFETIGAIAVDLFDATGLRSAQLQAEIVPPGVLEPDAACDLSGAFDVCPDGTVCQDTTDDGAVNPTCAGVNAPVLDSAAVFINAATLGFGLTMAGSDVEGDVVGATVTILDADGVDLFGETVSLEAFEEELTQPGDGTFAARMVRVLPAEFPADLIALVQVGAIDATGLESERVDVVPSVPAALGDLAVCEAPEAFEACPAGWVCVDPEADGVTNCVEFQVRAEGEICTPAAPDHVCDAGLVCVDTEDDGVTNCVAFQVRAEGEPCTPAAPDHACDAGLYCIVDAEGAGTCSMPVVECPAEFGRALSVPVGGPAPWSIDLDTTGAPNLNGGTCGGDRSGEAIVDFVAPAAGTYVARTVTEDLDTVLYARSYCGFVDSELDCSDDANGALTSEVTVTLDAGEHVFFFVEGFGAADVGPLTLTIEPAAVP